MDEPHFSKDAVRKTAALRLSALTPGEIRTQGDKLVELLGPWTRSHGFETVLATVPLAGEPDLTPFLDTWIAGGGKVALARTGPGRSLGFRYVSGLAGPWETRALGLKEPPLTAPGWEPGPKTLVLVPGLAFAPGADQRICRLGRGAGYYDRWLETHRDEVFSLGVALTVQLFPRIPVESHDQNLDGLLSPAGFQGSGCFS